MLIPCNVNDWMYVWYVGFY